MKVFYSPTRREIIYVNQDADHSDYWDRVWLAKITPKSFARIRECKDDFCTATTARFLQPSDGPLIEGGCGIGGQVYALAGKGYDVVGVDFADATLAVARENLPELKFQNANLEALPYPDAHFAGYWSIGVIEHFWDGYAPLASEMKRVIRPGGYLFLTFPSMSPVRRLKARIGCFPGLADTSRPAGFYQFLLDARGVARQFESLGFDLVLHAPKSGISGLAVEFPRLGPLLVRIFRGPLNPLLERVGALLCSHATLLILRRR